MAVQMVPWYQKVLGSAKQRALYTKYASIACGVALVATGLFYGYRWYVVYREREAQAVLSDYIHKAQSGSEASLAAIETLFQEGAQKQSGSYLEPYFLVFQANALIKEGKLDDAIAVMEKAIADMSKNNLLLPLFETKRALMQLDSGVEATKQAGFQKLTELAHNVNNPYADMALFFLGNYYWSADKLDDAKQVWQELIEAQRKQEIVASSPWAQLAHSKLQQITA
jgi:predicted negative regulator of RcsB-dependent stress response